MKLGMWMALAALAGCGVPEETFDSTAQELNGGTLVTTTGIAPFSSSVRWQSAGADCSAVKIGARKFLTAAHCLTQTPALKANDNVVITGNNDGRGAVSARVTSLALHPSFEINNNLTDGFDLAVFEVAIDTPAVAVAPLRAEFLDGDVLAVGVGYGCDSAAPGNDNQKQRDSMRTLTLPQWQALSGINPEVELKVHSYNLTINGNTDAFFCRGDDGGGLYVSNQLAGIHSTNPLASSAGKASAYARVGGARRWIESPAKNVFGDQSRGFWINAATNLWMSVAGLSTASGAPVIQLFGDARLQELDHQNWRLLAKSGGTFAIKNGNSAKCLGVVDGSTADNAKLAQFNCDDSASQLWRFTTSRPGFFKIVNSKSGRCAGLGSQLFRGAQFVQRACTPLDQSQDWVFSR
jgi:hypothetical protein